MKKRVLVLGIMIACIIFSSCASTCGETFNRAVYMAMFTSCSGNSTKINKTMYFVEGSFISVENAKTERIYYLNVTPISKDEYDSDKKNTLKDSVLKENNYFRVELYYYDEHNNKINCDFFNLKDRYTGNRRYPLDYFDDNINMIEPYTGNKYCENSEIVYGITYDRISFSMKRITDDDNKTNYFTEYSYALKSDGTTYYLDISSLDENEFILANGKNVVKDEILSENNYFGIDFYSFDGDGNKITYDFYNLQNTHPETTRYIVYYFDDNGNCISAKNKCITIRFNDLVFKFNPPTSINAGKFYDVCNGIPYYIEISTITEEEYISADGKNVIKDDTRLETMYFALDFYYFDKGITKISYDFYNLKAVYPNPNAEIYYTDDNGNILLPTVPTETDLTCYTLTYNGLHFNLRKY